MTHGLERLSARIILNIKQGLFLTALAACLLAMMSPYLRDIDWSEVQNGFEWGMYCCGLAGKPEISSLSGSHQIGLISFSIVGALAVFSVVSVSIMTYIKLGSK